MLEWIGSKMNLRIQQLADEAAKYSAIMAVPTGESGDKLFVERFAELIIRECTDLFADQQNMIVNPNKPFAYRTVRALQENDLDTVRKIKTHFGVEA